MSKNIIIKDGKKYHIDGVIHNQADVSLLIYNRHEIFSKDAIPKIFRKVIGFDVNQKSFPFTGGQVSFVVQLANHV